MSKSRRCHVVQVMWPRHCVQGTYGADFHPDLEFSPSDYVCDKASSPLKSLEEYELVPGFSKSCRYVV